MQASDFDFELPAAQIAQRPARRGRARLLVLDAPAEARHRRIADLPGLLAPGDLVVVNDTRVLPARLFAHRAGSGGAVELLLVERLAARRWLAMARPGRRLGPGAELVLEGGGRATVAERHADGRLTLELDRAVRPLLRRRGHVPLPPYIRRPDEPADRRAYQTIFARHEGSIAAPTAGLHFGRALLAALERRGVELATLTLHVGPGTFAPLRGDSVDEHELESERYVVGTDTAAAVERARRRGGRVVAVGTTVVRTLESVAVGGGRIAAGEGRTGLFIRPGHTFRVVDLLLTNFHLPRSTLLMLVAAFAGRERVLVAYREAIAAGYRFYSYGDAMLARRAAAEITTGARPPADAPGV